MLAGMKGPVVQNLTILLANGTLKLSRSMASTLICFAEKKNVNSFFTALQKLFTFCRKHILVLENTLASIVSLSSPSSLS